EYFIEGGAEGNDDLLFFVKAGTGSSTSPYDSPSSQPDGSSQNDRVFVRRKVANTMPALGDLVDWKQTFFLNLIVQLPCTLTVAVCKRSATERKRSLLKGEERIVLVGSPSAANDSDNNMNNSPSTDSLASRLANTSVSGDIGSSSPRPSAAKPKMTAVRRIPKTVYAAPYKSRMDVKDAFMNEVSYPNVYYTVNDYESRDLHLSIGEKEYLCVELSVIIPDATHESVKTGKKWTATSGTEAIAAIPLDSDSAPFPVPPDCTKIVLFQGAVPYTSLLDIFQTKGLAARSQLKISWKKLAEATSSNSSGSQNRKRTNSPPPERTEYIMMRGPHGKGQCQVAIKDDESNSETVAVEDDTLLSTTSPSSRSKPSTLTDRLYKLGSVVKTQLATSAVMANVATALGVETPLSESDKMKRPESLRCSMTYVNVPWQSI
ncbi:hypothetical protein DFS34DRAFT_564503, partial [Phlyctochytrium arcticum]